MVRESCFYHQSVLQPSMPAHTTTQHLLQVSANSPPLNHDFPVFIRKNPQTASASFDHPFPGPRLHQIPQQSPSIYHSSSHASLGSIAQRCACCTGEFRASGCIFSWMGLICACSHPRGSLQRRGGLCLFSFMEVSLRR